MDWNIITSIITMLCGGSIVSVITLFINRKSDRRKAEAQADHEQATADHEQATAELEKFRGWEVQIERMNNQIEVKDGRIEKLNQQLAEKEERFQKQMTEYRDQTRRLRECQDREYEANLEIKRQAEQIAQLTKELCELKLELKEKRCHHKFCLDRKPQNDNTRKAIAEVQSGKRPIKLLEAQIIEDTDYIDEDDDENLD